MAGQHFDGISTIQFLSKNRIKSTSQWIFAPNNILGFAKKTAALSTSKKTHIKLIHQRERVLLPACIEYVIIFFSQHICPTTLRTNTFCSTLRHALLDNSLLEDQDIPNKVKNDFG